MTELATIAKLDFSSYGYIVANIANGVEQVARVLKEEYQDRIELVHMVCDRYDIADAQQLRAVFQEKKTRDVRVVLVAASTFGLPPQNALLKLIEELSDNNHIIFIVPHAKSLLETIWSRLHRVEATETLPAVEVKDLFDISYKKRLDFVETHMKALAKNTSGEIRAFVISCIESYEQFLYDHPDISRKNIELVTRARKYSTEETVPPKYVLEMLAVATEV